MLTNTGLIPGGEWGKNNSTTVADADHNTTSAYPSSLRLQAPSGSKLPPAPATSGVTEISGLEYQSLEGHQRCNDECEQMEKALREQEESFNQVFNEMAAKLKEKEQFLRETAESQIQRLRNEVVHVQVKLKEKLAANSRTMSCIIRHCDKACIKVTFFDPMVARSFNCLFDEIRLCVLGTYGNTQVSQEVLRTLDPTIKSFFSTKIGSEWTYRFQEDHCMLLWAFIVSQLYEKTLNSFLCGVSAEVAGVLTFVTPCSSRLPTRNCIFHG